MGGGTLFEGSVHVGSVYEEYVHGGFAEVIGDLLCRFEELERGRKTVGKYWSSPSVEF